MKRSFRRVSDKLAEARFFFSLFASCADREKASYYFSAFVSAARSVTFTLQAVCARFGGFAAWYETERTGLTRDPVARFLLEARNETQKVGLTPVHSVGVSTSISRAGRFHCSVVYCFVALDGRSRPPSVDAVAACRAHLDKLSALVERCYDRFKAELDPAGDVERQVRDLRKAVKVRVPQCPLDRAMHRAMGDRYRAEVRSAAQALFSKGERRTTKGVQPRRAG